MRTSERFAKGRHGVMSKPENTFIASVHKYLNHDVYHVKNHNPYTAAIPDCWYSGKGKKSKDLWIEWKFIEVPMRDSTSIDLLAETKKDKGFTPLQQEWLKDRHAEGRHVAGAIGSKDGGVILWGLDWNRTFTAGEFRKMIVDRRTLAQQITQFVRGGL